MIAFVGQTVMQAEHFPQLLSISIPSRGNGALVKISPRKNQDPMLLLSNKVCLPIQPRFAFAATGFSSTGAESANTRYCW